MLCPNCKIDLKNNCCLRCGYMSNGNYSGSYNIEDKYKDIELYNDSYNNMKRNEGSFLIFILGTLYLSYTNHFLFGIIIGLIDLLLNIFISIKLSSFFNGFAPLILYSLLIIYFFINRLIYSMFLNILCLKLDTLKIKIIKSHHKNYKDILVNHKDKSIFLLVLNVIIYILLLIIIILYRRIENGTINI